MFATTEAAKQPCSQGTTQATVAASSRHKSSLPVTWLHECEGAVREAAVREGGRSDGLGGQARWRESSPVVELLETEAGEAVLPLFMSYHDCQAAIKQARDADGNAIPLETIGLSLPSVIEQLSSMVDDGSPPAFAFIAPSRSIEHIREKVASPPESPAPAPGDVAESDSD